MKKQRSLSVFKTSIIIGILSATSLNGLAQGDSCIDPIPLPSTGIYDVDYTAGDQWYSFVAPKSGDAVITTGTSSQAGVTNKLHSATGDAQFSYKNTKIEIYNVCGDPVWLSNDDYYGLFDGASEINPESHGFAFVVGQEYFIKMIDAPNDFQNEKGGQSPFEFFYTDDLIIGTEAEPLEITLGLNEDYAHLYYATEQWFSYELPADGIFNMEMSRYYDGSNTEISSNNAITMTHWNGDDGEPFNGFTIEGNIGDVLTFSLSGATRNNTFKAAFEDGIACSTPFDLTNNLVIDDRFTYSVDNTAGSQYFSVTAPMDGSLEMTTCTVAPWHNTYLAVYNSNCELITETGFGCTHRAAIDLMVEAGETYIFEWDPRELAIDNPNADDYLYDAQMVFHQTVAGESCDVPKTIQEGVNTVDYWFDDQYFTYTASSPGQLEIYTCSYSGFDLNGFELLDGCGGSLIGTTSYACDVYEVGVMSITYEISKNEVVKLRMLENYYERYDYTFEASFLPAGNTCDDPIDLNVDYPIDGNGFIAVEVDLSNQVNQFFTYTATQDGTIEMSSAHTSVDYRDSLRVYSGNCNNLIFAEQSTPGVLNAVVFEMEVNIGDTYWFEWVNIESSEVFEASFYFQAPVVGELCSEPIELVLGSNVKESFFKPQYFSYTAISDGILEVASCGINNAGLTTFSILDECDGSSLETISDACDPEYDYGWISASYEMISGESVIISADHESFYHSHEVYNFNANFNAAGVGNSCGNPIDLNVDYPIEGDGNQVIEVDATESNQFYKYTATESGVIEMTSTDEANTSFTMLKVYEGDCENLIETIYQNIGFGQAEFNVAVEEGDVYIFEWFENPEDVVDPIPFTVRFWFQQPVVGRTCESPKDLIIGSNTADYWLGNQFFSYTANASGRLTVSNCFVDNAIGTGPIRMYDTCEGTEIGSTTYCDNYEYYDDEDWSDVVYDISAGETVIIQTANPYYLHDFNAIFTMEGEACVVPIAINAPGVYDVAHIDFEDNDQWYKFTAPKSGSAIITTQYPSLASGFSLTGHSAQTNIEIYGACGGNLIAFNDDYEGYFGASRIDLDLIENTEYYILMIDEFINESYQFEIFYEDDLIIGTEENPLEAVLGYNANFANLRYVNTQWFSYEFAKTGQFEVELNAYHENAEIWTTLTANHPVTIFEDEDSGTPLGFIFDATVGDVLKFSLNGIAENTFNASFAEELCRGEYTVLPTDDLQEDYTAYNSQGDDVFRTTATKDGTLLITSCNDNLGKDTYVKVYELCEEEMLAESDDYCGLAARLEFEVTAGTTYEIVWDASKLNDDPAQSDFDFNFGYLDLINGQTQEEAIVISQETFGEERGTNTDLIEEQWFVVTLPDVGTVYVFEEGINALMLTSNDDGVVEQIDQSSGTYTGIVGDQVFLKFNNGGAYFNSGFLVGFDPKEACADINIVNETACGNFQFGEDLLTTSGQYIGDFVNQAACDSLVILNLSIFNCDVLWHDAVWSNVEGPVAGDEVVINDDYSTTINGLFDFQNLTVNESHTFTVNPETTLNVSGDLTNNGAIVVESGASMLTYAVNSITGNPITFIRNTRYADGRYSMVGSPVLTDSEITGADLGPTVYSYDETIAFNDGTEDGVNRWLNASTEELIPGKGYGAAGQQTITFEGVPNDGTITFSSLSRTEDATTTDVNWGWHLVSNPYPAALDLQAFIDGNADIQGFVALWDDPDSEAGRGDNGDYLIANAIGSVTGPNGGSFEGYIGSMQGFFIQVGDGQTGDVVFNEDMRIADNNADANFFRKSDMSIPSIKLAMISEDQYSETLIGFPTDATTGHDQLYDATKLKSQTNHNLYSMFESKLYAIQGLPLLGDEIRISLGLDREEGGLVTLTLLQDSDKFSDYELFIVDKSSSKEYSLSKSKSLEFMVESGVEQSRFELILRKFNVLGTIAKKRYVVFVEDNFIYVKGDGANLINYRLVNLMGQVVSQAGNMPAENSDFVISRPSKPGIYLLQLESNQTSEVHKLIIK